MISVSEKKPVNEHVTAMFESEVPQDLIVMMILLATGIATIFLPILQETPLRYVLTLPVILFIPGYCLIAVIFPKDDDIDILERIALSFGLSIAIVALIGLGLNFTPWGIRLEPIVFALTLFTFIMVLMAHQRRAILPAEKRFSIPVVMIARDLRQEMIPEGENTVDHLLSIGLVIAITIAVITTGFVILFPQEGERFSEFYVLSEERTFTRYPDRLQPGQTYPLYIGVGNQEQQSMSYTIEIWTLRTEFDTMTNTSSIVTMDPGAQVRLTLKNNETLIIPYNLSVHEAGYNRVDFLLFNETLPGSAVSGYDRINASYRNVHLWMTSPS